MTMTRTLTGASLAALALAGCAAKTPPLPVERGPLPEFIGQAAVTDPEVRSTIVGGTEAVPVPPQSLTIEPKRGDIAFNFPAADVGVVAKAVLGDVLRLQYSVAPGLNVQMSFVTPGAVARSAVLPLFESALRQAGLALAPVPGGFQIQQASAAQANGPVGPAVIGYGSEIITLQFINAEELKKLLDSVLPGVVTATDPSTNAITIVGTTGQRTGARDLVRQFDVNWLRNMSFALFVPQRTDSRLIVPELDKLINAADAPTRGLVRLISMENMNGILAITAQRQYLEDVRRWVEVLDREGNSAEPRLYVYRVQNGRARDLAQTINNAFGTGGDAAQTGSAGNADPFAQADRASPRPAAPVTSEGATPPPATGTTLVDGAAPPRSQNGRITADEVNNAVIVYGTPREYAVIEDALRRLDTRPVQVMIEAAITEVTLTDALRYGLQWNYQTGTSNFALSEGTTINPTRILPGFSYFLGANDINLTLNALEQRTNVKIISAPKLLVLNNQTAALQVGDQVPVSTGSATNIGGGESIVNTIEYRDTGVILKVTPRVNAGGLVLLDIAQEVSDVNTRVASNTSATSASPTISTRRVSTSIAAQDGQVIALGGLFRNAQTSGKNGIPFLSRIPIIGALFGDQSNDTTRTELIILLKPHVLRTAEDGSAITEELRRKLRTLEPFATQGKIP